MNITVCDGAGVIGGNKVLLESDRKAIFFDFGISYSVYSEYFEEFLKPRPARGVTDYFKVGLLPPIQGIYRKDCFPSDFDLWEELKKRNRYRELELSGVLLSHAHLDHGGHISFLDENIPIYCSALTAAILKAIQDTSQSDLEKEICYKIPRCENEDGLLKSSNWQKVAAAGRPFRLVNPGGIREDLQNFWQQQAGSRTLEARPLSETSSIDGMALKRFTVDHSIFGSSAFALQTKEGWVVYTGDVRLHGKKGDLTRSFAEKVAELKPLVLITEGTRIYGDDADIDVGFKENVDEDLVFENCLAAVKREKGLVIADFGPRNLERLLIFLEIAKRSGRKLAVMAKDAYLLKAVHAVIPEEVSDPSLEENIVIYRDVKTAPALWEKELLSYYNVKVLDGKQINKSQKEYIVCMSFLDINELIDISPDPGALYIYSSSEAYSEEQKIDFKRLLNWLNLYKIKPLGVPDPSSGKVSREENGLHASGHITASDLLHLIRIINPKIVVPVHTEHPEFFANELREYEVIVPKKGETIQIE